MAVQDEKNKKLPMGPWDQEPNWREWTDIRTGYKCLILRHPRMGHLCGYVGIPKIHKLFGKDEHTSLCDHQSCYEHSLSGTIIVHGGLTFSGVPGMEEADYEHADPRYWWYGFDCGHAGDLVPALPNYRTDADDEYRNMDYVEAQCILLAYQLWKLDK